MRIPAAPLLISITLLLSGCVSNPAARDALKPQVESPPPQNESQPVAIVKPEPKSIVPDINEKGRRGDIARMMLKKSSRQFLKADMDRDYHVSMEEAQQHLPHMSKSFSRYDKNNDQRIDWPEYLGHDEWPQPRHQ